MKCPWAHKDAKIQALTLKNIAIFDNKSMFSRLIKLYIPHVPIVTCLRVEI